MSSKLAIALVEQQALIGLQLGLAVRAPEAERPVAMHKALAATFAHVSVVNDVVAPAAGRCAETEQLLQTADVVMGVLARALSDDALPSEAQGLSLTLHALMARERDVLSRLARADCDVDWERLALEAERRFEGLYSDEALYPKAAQAARPPRS